MELSMNVNASKVRLKKIKLVSIAILLNSLFLGAIVAWALFSTLSSHGAREYITAIAVLALPVVNLMVLFSGKVKWRRLYNKRKALEEQKRIDELKGNVK